ncbi:MAG: Rrf2 family transcriptional regulator [Peptococcaceae bacterium]|jgi:Rrf2 family protein|nr:Rrf2 family transcriptional regulator [Peptococcaceae bacterium]
MKISTKGRYALMMLLDLAEHKDEGFIPLKDIAVRQGISKNYLEQIMPILKKTDILKTTRGFQGGYKLAKAPNQYTVGYIIRVTEGSIAPVVCLDGETNECLRSGFCKTLSVWRGLEQVIADYLDSITLQDILDKSDAPTLAHTRFAAKKPCGFGAFADRF